MVAPKELDGMIALLEDALAEAEKLKGRYTKAGGTRFRKKLDTICKEKIPVKKALVEFEKNMPKRK